MATCVARKGFLTLTDCGMPAVHNCATCGRPMCSVHLAPQSGFTKCLDCAVRDDPAKDLPAPDDQYGDRWAYSYRDRYYRTTGYQPFYVGDIGGDYYDDYDVRSFDDDANDDATDADEGTGGSFTES